MAEESMSSCRTVFAVVVAAFWGEGIVVVVVVLLFCLVV